MSENKDQQAVQLGPNDLQLFEYISTRYDAVIPQGVDPQQILRPEFWAHHAVKLRPMNEIRARSEDGTWLAVLVVLDCSRTWAKVHMLSLHRLTTSDVSLTQASQAEVDAKIDQHEIKFAQGRKWHVVRKGDRAVVQENIGEKEAAIAWLAKYARENAGVPAVVPPEAKPDPVTA